MVQGRFGFTESTPDHLQLDAGEFWANFDIEALLADAQDAETDVTDLSTYGLNDGTAMRLGSTEGGGEFSANRSINEMDFDGKLGPTKDMDRREEVSPELTADFQEFRKEVFEKAIVGSETSNVDDVTDVVEITGDEIKTADYIDNIVFIGKRKDGKPIMFEIENVLAEGDLSISTDHGGESVIPITFRARFDVEDATYDDYGGKEWQEPWRLVIYEDAT